MASGRVFFGRLRRLLGEKYTLGGPGRVRLPRTGPSRVVSPDNVSPHDRAARGRRIENEHETIYFGDDVVGRGEREAGSDGASPYPELRPTCAGASLRTVSRAIKVREGSLQRVDVADTL
jgi:hypothetical protein